MAQQKAAEAQAENPDDVVDELPAGTKLLRGQYTIVRYLNSGGFGITYLAKDSLDRNVVIKECFPSSYCRRSKTVVAARSRAHTAELRSVVQLFVREARNLAKIVHPNIVAVHQVFEDNFTAYMAIDYIDGLDLQEIIEGNNHRLSPQDIVAITEKLLGAVGFIHDHDMLHRDISPDNVLIDQTGEPILIDFGAARDEASQKSRAMSALRVVKDGYSPQEFYIAGSEQGPWSDLYALGATLFHLISGETPTNGQARLSALAEGRPDPYVPLKGRFPGYPPGFLQAIDKAMRTLPAQRVQSATEWLSMFRSGFVPASVATGRVEGAVRALVSEESLHVGQAPRSGLGARLADTDDLAEDGDISYAADPRFGDPPEYSAPSAAPMAASSAPSGRSGVPMIAAGVALLLVALGGGYMMMGSSDDPVAVTEPAAAETAAAEPVAEEAAATATVTETAPAATETAEAPAEVAPEEPEPVTEPTETLAADTTAADSAEPVETASTIAAPNGVLSTNQVGFAAWDATIPFTEENRVIGGQPVAVVSRILPSTNLAEAGNWLVPGLLLYTVNGNDIQQSGSTTTAILNAIEVDPDGKARMVVEYAGSSLERESGLLTVTATRIVNLANGVNLNVTFTDDKWQTVVAGVTVPEKTELRQGDILFRDRTTGLAIDGAQSLEDVMAKLVETGTGLTTFSVIRDNKVITVAMQLAVDP